MTMTIGYGVPSLRARSPKTMTKSNRRRKMTSISPIPLMQSTHSLKDIWG